MPITINGSGTVTGISAGGLPDDCITTAEIAANAVTTAKLGTSEASGLAKAWVNFNGTGTVAIRASFNVSSITDNGTGDYTVNFTTALGDANYVATTMAAVILDQGQSYQFGLRMPSGGIGGTPTTKTTTAIRLLSRREADTDQSECYVAIFR
jgi:hypothetical protein